LLKSGAATDSSATDEHEASQVYPPKLSRVALGVEHPLLFDNTPLPSAGHARGTALIDFLKPYPEYLNPNTRSQAQRGLE
jgi:hypothetical protein